MHFHSLNLEYPHQSHLQPGNLLLEACSQILVVLGTFCTLNNVFFLFPELRRGIQDASCVGPGKSNLPLELRRKAGDCSRVTAGPIDLI